MKNNINSSQKNKTNNSPSPSEKYEKKYEIPHALPYILFLVIVIYIAYMDNKHKIIIKDFSKFKFSFFVGVIIIVSIIIFFTGSKKAKFAARHAIVAFIIAYFAHLDLIFATYFLVFIVYYFSQKYVD